MKNHDRQIGIWLLVCCVFIAGMVVLGGFTRLTESGLSIVDWRPVTGVVPPLSAADWEAEFAKYQTSPEFEKVNTEMTAETFKTIYWLEYLHRLLGRAVGLLFFVPLVWFIARKQVPKAKIPVLWGIFLLGGLQGLVGWYMVKSGLVDRPEVSHYRLALHLGLAFLLFGLVLMQALQFFGVKRQPCAVQLRRMAQGFLAIVSVQIIVGAFVAGLKAGLMYNTFPLMGNALWPPLFTMSPWYMNLLENPGTLQFIHRLCAFAIVALVVALVVAAHANEVGRTMKRLVYVAAVVTAMQVVLGVATLLRMVPTGLAAAHQFGGLLLFTSALLLLYRCGPEGVETVDDNNIADAAAN
jgi:cytochrome c oxidase assembly protein subunit 15